MGMIKDAIRKVLTEEAAKTGRHIAFLDTPTRVVETAQQAKQHDMELVEKPQEREYAPIVYKHNPYAIYDKSLLFLYVLDQRSNKAVAYISIGKHNLHICRGCSFGEYNVWHRDNPHLVYYGRNAHGLREATELLESMYAQGYYKFIITEKGKAVAQEILQQK